MSAPPARDEELSAGRRSRDWRTKLLWTVLGLLALLFVMTALGLSVTMHGGGGMLHRPPMPRPVIRGDMPHG